MAEAEEVEAQALVLGVVVGAGVRRRGDDAGGACRRGRPRRACARRARRPRAGVAGRQVGEAGDEELDALREQPRRRRRAATLRSTQVASVSRGARRDLVEDRRQARGEDVGELGVVLRAARRGGAAISSSSRRTCGANQLASRRLRAFGSKPAGLRIGAGSAPERRAALPAASTAPAIAWPASRSACGGAPGPSTSWRARPGRRAGSGRRRSRAGRPRAPRRARCPSRRTDRRAAPRRAARRRGDELDEEARGRRVQARRVAVERVGQRLGDLVVDRRRAQRGHQRRRRGRGRRRRRSARARAASRGSDVGADEARGTARTLPARRIPMERMTRRHAHAARDHRPRKARGPLRLGRGDDRGRLGRARAAHPLHLRATASPRRPASACSIPKTVPEDLTVSRHAPRRQLRRRHPLLRRAHHRHLPVSRAREDAANDSRRSSARLDGAPQHPRVPARADPARARSTPLFAAAQHAPSWCNVQPWRVVVTEPPVTGELAAALRRRGARSGFPHAEVPFPLDYPSPYKEHRIACGVALYQAMGVAPRRQGRPLRRVAAQLRAVRRAPRRDRRVRSPARSVRLRRRRRVARLRADGRRRARASTPARWRRSRRIPSRCARASRSPRPT